MIKKLILIKYDLDRYKYQSGGMGVSDGDMQTSQADASDTTTETETESDCPDNENSEQNDEQLEKVSACADTDNNDSLLEETSTDGDVEIEQNEQTKPSARALKVRQLQQQTQHLENYAKQKEAAYEIGIEWLYDVNSYEFDAKLYQDISSTHKGFTGSLRLAKYFYWPKLILRPSVQLTYQSQQYNQYYWSVPADYFAGHAYHADAGINTQLQMIAAVPITKHLTLIGLVNKDFSSSSITDSPLYRIENDKLSHVNYFMGMQWSF